MELRNQLSQHRLDRLRPLPLIAEFTAAAWPGPVALGTVPADHLVRKAVVEILEVFDGGAAITVGDAVAQGRFQAVADNTPSRVFRYNHENDYRYDTDTAVAVYLPAGAPTVGRARVILYLD